MIIEYILKEEDAGKTINQVLMQQFEFSSKLFNKLIRDKKILKNDENVDTRLIANVGDKLIVDLNYEEDNSNIVSRKMNLDIVYEDEALLVINKPAGIAIHPSILHYEDSLANGVKYYFEINKIRKKIRPVNRLDLNTSGLVVFAKNEYVQENLIRQMKNGTFIKEYLAIVEGKLKQKSGVINAPISRKEGSIIERCISKYGQEAITEYEVIKNNDEYSIVRCKLLTGRTHQIRVHFAHIGHPLLGDTLYGKKSELINRQALHSYKLTFIHPINKQIMTFENNGTFI